MSGAEIIGAAVGLVLGVVVMLLWTVLGRFLVEGRFWPSFRQLARDLAAGAPPESILRQYADLIKLLALYIAKTTCRIGIAILPVVLCCTLLAPVAFQAALKSARGITIYPAQSVRLTLADRTLTSESPKEVAADPAQWNSTADGTFTLEFDVEGLPRLRKEIERGARLEIVAPESKVVIPHWTAPVALSRSAWTCVGLQLLGMEAHHASDGPSLLLVRPAIGDENSLYPYLSDIELAFWAGLIGSSLLAGLVLKPRRKGTTQA